MEFFNANLYLTGIITGIATCSPLMFWILLCIIYKIKIIDLKVYYSLLYGKFHEMKLNYTNLRFSYLPVGGSVEALGYDTEKEATDLELNNLDYSFRTKSNILRYIFKTIPLISVLLLIITLGYFTSFSLVAIFEDFSTLAITTLKDVFTLKNKSIELLELSFNKYGKFIFTSLTLLFTLTIVNLIFFGINYFLISKVKRLLYIGYFFYFIVFFYLYILLPSFFFSLNTFQKNIIYMANFLAGTYSVGAIFYVLSIIAIKEFGVKIRDIK